MAHFKISRNDSKSHPLELNDGDEDEKYYDTIHLDDSSITLPKTQKILPKTPKRIAPKLPVETEIYVGNYIEPKKNNLSSTNSNDYQQASSNNQINNFFINFESVGWFFKKDPRVNSENSQSTSVADEVNENNNSSSTTNNTNNTASTTNNKKWVMFSKWDAYNLEAEYRDMMSKKQSNNSNTEPKLVQVLDNLYEVNLATRKCYAIYWRNGRTMTVMRSLWFNDGGEPFEEKPSEEIEKKHVELFKDAIIASLEGSTSVNSDADIKLRAESPSPTDETSPKNQKPETFKERMFFIW